VECTAVFDVDGVIADVRRRLRKCLSEVNAISINSIPRNRRELFWNLFLSDKYMHLDEPNLEVINYIRKLKSEGYKIVIITGRRSDTQRRETLRQLREWGVPYDEIFFRRRDDRRPDSSLKAGIIKWLLSRGYRIVEVWDDSGSVIEKLKKILPPKTKIVHYSKLKQLNSS